MKNNLKNKALNLVKKVAYQSAEKNANSACPAWTFQTKLPEKVQKLRKF